MGYWTKVYQICGRINIHIDGVGVNATTRVAVRPSVVE